MINMQKMNKKQAGFTLIELVMVIVILGILSAFALPRFADLTGNAREASLDGLAGSLKSASAIAHAQWIADGSSSTAPNITLEGATITMTSTGYPDAVAAGITSAAQVDSSYTPSADAAGGTLTYTLQTGCTVAYDASATPPTVTTVKTSC